MTESEKSKRWREKNPSKRMHYMRKYRTINTADIVVMLGDSDEIWFERDARKRKLLKRATPSWADRGKIRKIYQQAVFETARHNIEFVVIHIYPIAHRRFSGLHVENNLRIVSASYKKRMGRKFNKNYL